MNYLKQIIFLLFAPFAACGQTIHSEDDRIVYKGTITVENADQAELYQRAKSALHYVNASTDNLVEDKKENGKIIAPGKMKLKTPYSVVRTVFYNFELSVEEGKVKYRIDSVYLKNKVRGGNTTVLSSDKILKAVEETGPPAIEAEKQLNEIDMNFQKIIAIVISEMKKAPVAKGEHLNN